MKIFLGVGTSICSVLFAKCQQWYPIDASSDNLSCKIVRNECILLCLSRLSDASQVKKSDLSFDINSEVLIQSFLYVYARNTGKIAYESVVSANERWIMHYLPSRIWSSNKMKPDRLTLQLFQDFWKRSLLLLAIHSSSKICDSHWHSRQWGNKHEKIKKQQILEGPSTQAHDVDVTVSYRLLFGICSGRFPSDRHLLLAWIGWSRSRRSSFERGACPALFHHQEILSRRSCRTRLSSFNIDQLERLISIESTTADSTCVYQMTSLLLQQINISCFCEWGESYQWWKHEGMHCHLLENMSVNVYQD